MKKRRLKTVVISLDTAEERRSSISQMLERTSIEWSFFSAHRDLSAPDLHHDYELTMRRYGRSLGLQQMAVYSSHYAVIRSFLDDSNFDFLLVLEDDVLIDVDFPLEEFAVYCGSLGMDYIRVFGKHYAPARKIGFFYDRNMIRYQTSPLGAQAYILSKRGARILADALREVDATIDIAMDRFWQMKLPIYGIYPYPVIERYSPTQIPISSGEDRLSTIERFSLIFYRISQKLQKISWDLAMTRTDSRVRAQARHFEQIVNPADLMAPPGIPMTTTNTASGMGG